MRVGFVALTDAAPFAVAEANNLFSAHGLQVQLHREIGWATVRDKIIYGELDAAHAPAPMLWSAQLGIHCPPCDVLTAFVLNQHGNALTLSQRLWDAGVCDDATLRELIRERRRAQPLTFGVVFPFSSHHLMLRDWLQSLDVDPQNDVKIVVVPPAQMFRNLAAGTLDGFSAGEPWNSVAVREGIGWCRMCSALQQPGHVEKVVMVTRQFAESRAAEHAGLLAALSAACAWCDETQNRESVAALMAGPRYLNTPERLITPALTGHFDFGHGSSEAIPNFHVFSRGGANVPNVEKAAAMQNALIGAGLVPVDTDPNLPRRLFREDLHREILHTPNEIAHSSDLSGVASNA